MTAPGVPGRLQRRLVAAMVLGVGALNVMLAAKRHPIIHMGRLHESLPHSAVHGSRYLLLAVGIALISSAPGLLHGKRHAWRVSAIAIVAALVAYPLKRLDYVGTSVNAAGLLVLISTVHLFPARSDRAKALQGLIWLAIGELAVFAYGAIGIYSLDAHFAQSTSLAESLENSLRLLLILPDSTVDPATQHGQWFLNSVRVSALAVLVISVWHLLHPVIHRAGPGRQEREKVEQILRLHATTALAYFHLLDDKSYFFSSDERAFISYRVIGHTAVALGEPIGEPLSRRKVVEEFAQHCDLNAWAFCFHQVSAEGAEELRDLGLSALKIGEEAVVPLEQFSLSGKSFKHIRNTVNRLEREGYVFQRLPAPIPPATMDDLAALSDAWLQSGGHRERAFTLGAFSASYLQATPVFVVRRPGERIEAFVNVIPSYGSGQGNFDLMRRRPDAPDGVMDLLFVRLMEHFQREGYSGMNLGFAPLANVEGPGLVARALRILYSRGNGAFKFEGLHSFKDKWQPNWEPKYLVYRSDLQLPQLALAVARAGERTGRLPALGLPNFGRVLHVPVLQPQRGGDA